MDYRNLLAKLETGEINIEHISDSSEEHRAIYFASTQGIPSAAYYLGLLKEKVLKQPDAALRWYKEAEKKNYTAASEAVQRVEKLLNEQRPTSKQAAIEMVAAPNAGTDNQLIPLNIKKHDFQNAKEKLQTLNEGPQECTDLIKVATSGGLFGWFNHKVTGDELNILTGQIQTYLININKLNARFIEEFKQVYQAFEALDKDYITSIVAAFKAAEKVSIEEQQDRKKIEALVDQLGKAVDVLKRFKDDIDKLKHLTDIDKTYTDFERLKENFSKVTDELNVIHAYCDALSKLQHLEDIDELWDNHKQTVDKLSEATRCLQETQQQFSNEVKQMISDYRKDSDRRISAFTKTQTAKLDDIDHRYTATVQNLTAEQKAKLTSIETSLKNSLDSAVQKQTLAIKQIERTQEERFEALFAKQSSTLEQISNDQLNQLTEINKSLEEEKLALNEQVTSLTQKVKRLSIVAGGAAALTVIQLLLNIFGV